VRSGSILNVLPTLSTFGHNVRAIDWETTATGCSSLSAVVNARPRTIGMPSTSKYSAETCLYESATLPPPASANPRGGNASNGGLTPANARTVGSLASARTMASRLSSLMTSIESVSTVRNPGLNCDDATALRRKIAEQINSSADAKTCTPIRMLRARPGRAALTSSPRSVRTGSTRVACNAGINAKHAVEAMAETTRNRATRQSAAGTLKLTSPRSMGSVRIAQ